MIAPIEEPESEGETPFPPDTRLINDPHYDVVEEPAGSDVQEIDLDKEDNQE